MADSILREKAKNFAKETVFTCRDMKKDKKESVLINQMLRSATSIGAVQIYTKHNMHKELKILYRSLK